MSILRVTKDDYGNYTCRAKNAAGEDEARTLINVLIRPRIYELWNVTRGENTEAEIVCKATGRPPPEITFRFVFTTILLLIVKIFQYSIIFYNSHRNIDDGAPKKNSSQAFKTANKTTFTWNSRPMNISANRPVCCDSRNCAAQTMASTNVLHVTKAIPLIKLATSPLNSRQTSIT